jgi:hypothetical protein
LVISFDAELIERILACAGSHFFPYVLWNCLGVERRVPSSGFSVQGWENNGYVSGLLAAMWRPR